MVAAIEDIAQTQQKQEDKEEIETQDEEVEGRQDEAWKLYRKAFKLWPPLEHERNCS